MAHMSRSALDRLGERLGRTDLPSDEDRDAYDEYRASFADAWLQVLDACRDIAGTPERPGGRLKTLESTVAKLRRGTFRLSQIHDIAGARLVLRDLSEQEEAAQRLASRYPGSRLLDYREQSQNGYRAVHLVAEAEAGAPVEIQLRTASQDMWANLCEEAANLFDLGIKYGEGPAEILELLQGLSEALHPTEVGYTLLRRVRHEQSRGYLDQSTRDLLTFLRLAVPITADQTDNVMEQVFQKTASYEIEANRLLVELVERLQSGMDYNSTQG